jgi:hypothetical protein
MPESLNRHSQTHPNGREVQESCCNIFDPFKLRTGYRTGNEDQILPIPKGIDKHFYDSTYKIRRRDIDI